MKPQSLYKAFQHAWDGMVYFFRTDRNGRIHLLSALVVLGAGWYFSVSLTEWCLLLGCIGLVVGMEMLNYALEKTCDMIHSEWHPMVKVIKDVSAGAVLWVAIASAMIGLLIFVPKILLLV
jgi:diacylglycerol kinase